MNKNDIYSLPSGKSSALGKDVYPGHSSLTKVTIKALKKECNSTYM